MTDFAVPTAGAGLGAITAGPDGNLWFLENLQNSTGQIGKITPSGTVTEYPLNPAIAGLGDITAGPDGNLWFTCQINCGLGYITPSGDVDTNFDVVLGTEDVAGITTGPDGNLWFAYGDEPDIGTMTPGTSGTATNFIVNGGLQNPCCGTWGITAGPDGNLWFTEPNLNEIGVITTSGAITAYTDSSSIGYGSIVAGPDGNLWFTEPSSDQIGKITTSGVITQYPIPSGNSPVGLTVGPDGNLWFTEPSANQIGMITTSGAVTEYPGPNAGGSPAEITTGPDGNLWFTDTGANQIVKIAVAPGTTTTSLSSSADPSVFGQPVTVTATVTAGPGQPTPTGTVQFSVDDQALGVPVTLANGSATSVPFSSLAVGHHTVVAAYTPDANFGPSTGTLTPDQNVQQGATGASLTSSPNPSLPGKAVTYTATVAPVAPAAGTPTGTVSFSDGTTPIAGCAAQALSGTTATCTVTYTSDGSHSVTASYGGDTNFAASAPSNVVSQFVGTVGPAPVIASISPAFGPAAGGTGIRITGDNLCQVNGVDFGSAAAVSFAVASNSTTGVCRVTATSPPGSGVVDVTVTSPGGTSATGPQDHFSYAPVIASISPAFGPAAGRPGIRITGDNLCQVNGVDFGSAAAVSFAVASNSTTGVCRVTATSPPGSGVVDVTVTSPGGTSATGPQDHFSYAPVIASISPAFGPAAGRPAIRITGDNLCQVNGVDFGSAAAATFSVATTSTRGVCVVTATSPPGSGVVDVTVTSPGGTSATGPQDHFSYAPVIASISPAFGPAAGRTAIRITGDNLCQVNGVDFGSAAAATFSVATTSTRGVCVVTATSPPGSGVVDVTVTSPGGTSATGPQDHFSYAPVIASISPAFGPAAGGTTIKITGDNLCQVNGVDFGSAAAARFAVATTSTRGVCVVKATSPPGSGVVDVTVTSPGGTSATGPQDHFSYQ